MKRKENKDGGGARGSNIKIYVRLRPTSSLLPYVQLPQQKGDLEDNDAISQRHLSFEIPREVASGYVNNTKTNYRFQFDGILDMSATQDAVFEMIGQDAVTNALQGYNSTIFAYGQTGSGKTFTITGGPERYADRGIIPRAISTIFNEMKKSGDIQYQVYVSYLEVYNEVGYDLLDASYEASHATSGASTANSSLPRVSLLEDDEGNCHLKNLSMHLVASEEEALNFLFLGDTNRAISETAMNQASSRSHCIFSISTEGRRTGSDRVLRSKLNLVDLAGSERVHKTHAGGQTLKEAKYINQSLFYLEMVILALHEKRSHVPYRNSMMTSVLRDSLGGNCKTIMIATISAERSNTDESISTCRFAQRVAQIKNDAHLNEELDPYQVIQRLKTELSEMKAEMAYLKGEAGEEKELKEEEKEKISKACEDYVYRKSTVDEEEEEGDGGEKDKGPSIGQLTLDRIYYAFQCMKKMVLLGKEKGGERALSTPKGEGGMKGGSICVAGAGGEGGEGSKTLEEFRELLAQRDYEIAILVNMVKTSSSGGKKMSLLPQGPAAKQPPQRALPVLLVPRPGPEHGPILEDAAKSFEYFKVRYPRAGDVEENKRLLKEKYSQAKALGERVNQARNTITYLKKTIEQLRRERAMEGLTRRQRGGEGKVNDKKEDEEDERPGEEEEDEEEADVRQAIEREKVVYQESFQNLRELKGEIEGIQRILERGRIRMQVEFDEWYARVLDMSSHSSSSTSSTTGGGIITRTTAAPSPPSSPFLAQEKPPTSASYHAEDRYRRPVPETTTPSETTSTASLSLASTYAASCSDSSSDRERKQEIEILGSNSNNSGAEEKEGGGRDRGSSTAATAARYYTGNKEADDDIAAFYRAKDELLRRTLNQQQHQQAPPAAAGPSPSNTTRGYQQDRK